MDVQPNQGGDILASDITASDILCGRGTKYCNHDGNKRYHLMVSMRCIDYGQAESKEDKTKISRSIVEALRNSNSPSRFIQKSDRKDNDGTEIWQEVGNKKSWEKTSQLLREMVSKGAHKTIYQKRKFDKELRRQRSKQGKKMKYRAVSPPSFQHHSPRNDLNSSCFSSGGSTRSGLTSHSSDGSYSSSSNSSLGSLPGPPIPQDADILSSMRIQNINLNVNDLMTNNCNLPMKYYDFIGKHNNMTMPLLPQDVPPMYGQLSNDPALRLLLESRMRTPAPYVNPYANNNLPLMRNQAMEGTHTSFSEYTYNNQQYGEENRNNNRLGANMSMWHSARNLHHF
jgi:hypothetical protein